MTPSILLLLNRLKTVSILSPFLQSTTHFLVLSQSLGDREPECRMLVIRELNLTHEADFLLVLKLAHHDPEVRVQREAIARLTEDMPFDQLPMKERMLLLERLIAHPAGADL